MYRPLETRDAGHGAIGDAAGIQLGRPRATVLVFHEGETRGIRQPIKFQCCPLGLHFYSHRQVQLYQLLEFAIHTPRRLSPDRHISCVGVVAGCVFDVDSGMYRICVKFLEVPEEARKQLEHLSRGAGLLCPYCENF